MKNEIALVFIFVFTPKISCVLHSCSESVPITQLCNRFENYRANTAPKPWPVIVNPILDFKNILEIESDEKTMTVYINFIMNWIDQEIYVNPADGKKYAFCTQFRQTRLHFGKFHSERRIGVKLYEYLFILFDYMYW